MGALAGTIGSFLQEYKGAVNMISGLVVILFGLIFLGIFKMNLFRGGSKTVNSREMGFFSAMLFGMIFSLGWTPCVGTFLGSALMLASGQGHVIEGMLMLLCYSLGLGIPFLLSAVLIDYLKSAFNWIKKHYRIINTVSGCFLILVGILMFLSQNIRPPFLYLDFWQKNNAGETRLSCSLAFILIIQRKNADPGEENSRIFLDSHRIFSYNAYRNPYAPVAQLYRAAAS